MNPGGLGALAAAALTGLIAGSFMSLCADRLPQGLSVVRPGSQCRSCGRLLSSPENIPLASFILQNGLCRGCGARIAWRDPILELGTAAAFAWAWWTAGPGLGFIRLAFLSALLLTLAATDLEYRQLPDELTLGGWAVGLALSVWTTPGLAASAIASFVAAGLLALVGIGYMRLRGREGLGWGDVKMAGMLGAFLGPNGVLTAVFLGSLAGALIGIVQTAAVLIQRRRRGRNWRQARASAGVYLARAGLPLGLFLALGTAATLLLDWRLVR